MSDMGMTLIYACEPLPTTVTRTVFLAGPTPRNLEATSWRPDAIKALEEAGFDGHIFVPEDRFGVYAGDYDKQVTWETEALNRADVILFWVPRDLKLMPAFTTNVEFGLWCQSGKVVLGSPPEAAKNQYLEYHAETLGVPITMTLESTVAEALKRVPVPAPREGGECEVPFHVWQSPSFQAWIRAQKVAGNRLDGAKLVWNLFSTKEVPVKVFFWALHVKVWVASEKRHKANEVVLSRPDISTVVLYRRDPTVWDSEVALVREFRSPVRNSEGFVFEAPGGSSPTTKDPYQVAVQEVFEETGLWVDPSRVTVLEDRQVCATLSTHKSHLFSVELTFEEMAWFRGRVGVVCGEDEEERTTVEVFRIRDLLVSRKVDWAMLGMIYRAVLGPNFIPKG